MKTISILLAALLLSRISADDSATPSTAVVVSTETVTKTVTREPRMVVLVFDDVGQVTTDIAYETVTRIGTNVVARVPFKTSSLTWLQVTNLVPSLAQGLEEFKLASKTILTNSP
jgi:hypothetical protein